MSTRGTVSKVAALAVPVTAAIGRGRSIRGVYGAALAVPVQAAKRVLGFWRSATTYGRSL